MESNYIEKLAKHGIRVSTITTERGQNYTLRFYYNALITNAILQIDSRRWNPEIKAWTIKKNPLLLEKLIVILKGNEQTLITKDEERLQKLEERLSLQQFSTYTLKNYKQAFAYFLKFFNGKDIEKLPESEMRNYLYHLAKDKLLSESTVNMHINAFKAYYSKVLHRHLENIEIPRPKKPILSPNVLSVHEVEKIFSCMHNFKHRVALYTIYSAGLRVSEAIAIQISDIDSSRMVIHIRRGKGKKDRMVMLSEKLLKILREYFIKYKPKQYLFEGQSGGAYSMRSLQKIFEDAKRRAGIRKPGGIHTLRHSFATHLVENGTHILYIKELLGHVDVKTTLKYAHVDQNRINRVKSPLDNLDLG